MATVASPRYTFVFRRDYEWALEFRGAVISVNLGG